MRHCNMLVDTNVTMLARMDLQRDVPTTDKLLIERKWIQNERELLTDAKQALAAKIKEFCTSLVFCRCAAMCIVPSLMLFRDMRHMRLYAVNSYPFNRPRSCLCCMPIGPRLPLTRVVLGVCGVGVAQRTSWRERKQRKKQRSRTLGRRRNPPAIVTPAAAAATLQKVRWPPRQACLPHPYPLVAKVVCSRVVRTQKSRPLNLRILRRDWSQPSRRSGKPWRMHCHFQTTTRGTSP